MSKPVSDNDTQALEANVKSVIARSDKWQARAEAAEAELDVARTRWQILVNIVAQTFNDRIVPGNDAGAVSWAVGEIKAQGSARTSLEARCKRLEGALRHARPLVEKWCHYQGCTAELFHEHLGPIDRALSDTAQQRDCPGCEGRGSLMGTNCDECKGTGRIPIDPETGGADG